MSFFRKKSIVVEPSWNTGDHQYQISASTSSPEMVQGNKKVIPREGTTIKIMRAFGVDKNTRAVTDELDSSFSSMCQGDATGKLRQRLTFLEESDEPADHESTVDKESFPHTPSEDTDLDASTTFSQYEFDSFSETSEDHKFRIEDSPFPLPNYVAPTASSSSLSSEKDHTPSGSLTPSPRESSPASSHSSTSSLSSVSPSSSSSTSSQKAGSFVRLDIPENKKLPRKTSASSLIESERERSPSTPTPRTKQSKGGIFKGSFSVLDSSFSLRRTSDSEKSMTSPRQVQHPPSGLSSSSSNQNQDSKRLFKRATLSSGDMNYINDIQQDINSHGDDIIFGGLNESTATPTIIGATPDRLVERLTYEKYPDPHLIQVFLLTYRSFMTPRELLEKLKQRWRISPPDNTDKDFWSTNIQKPIQLRVFNALKLWLFTYFKYDFMETEDDVDSEHEDSLLESLRQFIVQEMSPVMEKMASTLLTFIKKNQENSPPSTKLKKQQKRTEQSAKTSDSDSTGSTASEVEGKPSGRKVLEMSRFELASELTRKEWKLFQALEPKECLNRCWIGNDKEKKSPNIIRFIERFNEVAKWVATEILSCQELEERIAVLEFFIDVAQHLRDLRNLNGVMEILAGFQTIAVYRLRNTWGGLAEESRTTLQSLTNLMSTEDNFSNFRKALLLMDPPCIPFLGVFLTDLVFIEEGNPSTIGEKNLVNFKKLSSVAEVLLNIQRFQKTPYTIGRNPIIHSHLRSIVILEENELLNVSLKVEPRLPRNKKKKA